MSLAADLDGDTDMDVISVSSPFAISERAVVWFENLDGAGTFGPERALATEPSEADSASVADVDGDGDEDVLVAICEDAYEGVAFYENQGQGDFAPQSGRARIRRRAARPWS